MDIQPTPLVCVAIFCLWVWGLAWVIGDARSRGQLGCGIVLVGRNRWALIAVAGAVGVLAGRGEVCPAEKEAGKQAVLSFDFEDGRAATRFARMAELDVAEKEGVGDSTALRAEYIGYDRGSRRIVTRLALPSQMAEASLCYDVRFDKDFQFVNGGKLHGLGPAKPITGGNAMKPDGWSARVTFGHGGSIHTYTYCQNKQRRYGISGKSVGKFRFEKDRYYSVSLHVKVNTPGKADGFSHLYVDGKPIVRHDGIRFRDAGGNATLINTFLFSTFHGGNRPSNAPRKKDGSYATVHAYFDNMSVYPGKHVRLHPNEP